jgi:hypothetical protein
MSHLFIIAKKLHGYQRAWHMRNNYLPIVRSNGAQLNTMHYCAVNQRNKTKGSLTYRLCPRETSYVRGKFVKTNLYILIIASLRRIHIIPGLVDGLSCI